MARKWIVSALTIVSAFVVVARWIPDAHSGITPGEPAQDAQLPIDTKSGIVNGQLALPPSTQRVEWKVQAVGHEALADPGGTGHANISVLVTRNGLPVSPLYGGNFVLQASLVPVGHTCLLEANGVSDQGVGLYVIQIRPTTCTWQEGKYIVRVIAYANTVGGGQALAEFDVK